MKTRHFIILGTILLILGLIYIPILNSNKAPDKKKSASKSNFIPVLEANNITRIEKLEAYGQVTPNLQLDVIMEVQGRLLRGNKTLKPGTSFKKGTLLYSVERIEELYTMFARKSGYAALVTSILPDIQLDFASEKNKWEKFAANIREDQPLPSLPLFKTGKEKRFVNSRNITTEYYAIKAAETRLDKYFYIAPFNGTVTQVYAEPGAMASPGMRIASIVKTGDYEVKVPIQKNNIGAFKKNETLTFYNPEGVKVGSGTILRISDIINPATQSIDVYFSIKTLANKQVYQGDFLNLVSNIKVEKSSTAIPISAINQDKVQILENGKIKSTTVSIVGKNADSIYISGISSGSMIVLEPILSIVDTLMYEGIEK